MEKPADKFPQDQILLREKGREAVIYVRLVGVEREVTRRPTWQGGAKLGANEALLAGALLAQRPDLGLRYARIFQRAR